MAAHWMGFKIMVKTDYAMYFGAGEIKAAGNTGHH
jgi:hypothetical protein